MDIIAPENIPTGYDIIFLLYSDIFKGQVNACTSGIDNERKCSKTVKSLIYGRNVD